MPVKREKSNEKSTKNAKEIFVLPFFSKRYDKEYDVRAEVTGKEAWI